MTRRLCCLRTWAGSGARDVSTRTAQPVVLAPILRWPRRPCAAGAAVQERRTGRGTVRVAAWNRANGPARRSAAAAAYAEHRPDYAQAAVRWALEPAPGPRVLDLGAGTGKLTAVLVALGADVIAVEPDPAMLAGLRRALPDVRALPGRRITLHQQHRSHRPPLCRRSPQRHSRQQAAPPRARRPMHGRRPPAGPQSRPSSLGSARPCAGGIPVSRMPLTVRR